MTDELRALLRARGVEFIEEDEDVLRVTIWRGPHGQAVFREWRTGTTRFEARGVDAATAVAATLGEREGSRETFARIDMGVGE